MLAPVNYTFLNIIILKQFKKWLLTECNLFIPHTIQMQAESVHNSNYL